MREPSRAYASGASAPRVSLRMTNGAVAEGQLRGVSLNGLHLHFDDPPEGHGPCHVHVFVQTDTGPLEVQCAGSILTRFDTGVMMYVASIAGAESLEHLQLLATPPMTPKVRRVR